MPPLPVLGDEMEMVSRTVEAEVTIEDLFLEIERGEVNGVKEMLDENLEKAWKVEAGACGRNALQVACSFPNMEVVLLLIKYGWSVNEKDARGKTPLHYASINGCTEIASALISNGANVNSKDKWGQTPLHLASHYGDTRMCLLLLKSGTDAKGKDSSGSTAVQVAATPAVRDFLLDSMKNLRIN
eukprot:TRINITY_DN7418_c0_g1_i1.p1 TRINITY_DN7418_c0_g1~~TRINITY_DN7418_c0_g1_i1.p1  ORF type:complete len:185 (+),score=43.17 TRINITY_DN7418_c0_g1_i1:48-602(+)